MDWGLIAVNNLGWAVAQEKSLKGNDLSVVYSSGTQVNFRWYMDKHIFYFKDCVFSFNIIYSRWYRFPIYSSDIQFPI